MPLPNLGLNSFANAGRQGGRAYVNFGGLPVPVGSNFGANLAYVDLNDGQVWYAQDLVLPDSHELEIAQLLWRAKQAYVAEDWGPLKIAIPFEYNGVSIWDARKLMTYGEQYLTFDGIHAYAVRCKSLGDQRPLVNAIPDARTGNPWWKGELEFWMREPFLKTIIQSTQLGQAIAGAVSPGAATTFNVTYGGSFQAEPQWILNVPNTNAAVITQLKIQNTTSGETVVIALNLSASNAHTVTVDAGALTVLVDGSPVDLGGTPPLLYPGANSITVTLTAAAATSGVTMDVKWFERWV